MLILPVPFSRVDVQRVAGAGHGDVEQAALFLVVQRLVVGLGERIRVAQFPGKGNQRLLVGSGERRRIGAENEDVGKFQSLGAVHGHEADGVFVFVSVAWHQGNHAAGFAEESEIVDQFFQVGGLVDLLRFPVLYELQAPPEEWARRHRGQTA